MLWNVTIVNGIQIKCIIVKLGNLKQNRFSGMKNNLQWNTLTQQQTVSASELYSLLSDEEVDMNYIEFKRRPWKCHTGEVNDNKEMSNTS